MIPTPHLREVTDLFEDWLQAEWACILEGLYGESARTALRKLNKKARKRATALGLTWNPEWEQYLR